MQQAPAASALKGSGDKNEYDRTLPFITSPLNQPARALTRTYERNPIILSYAEGYKRSLLYLLYSLRLKLPIRMELIGVKVYLEKNCRCLDYIYDLTGGR